MVGQHIGKYRVTRQVGRGGMGTVYAAIDETLHRDVAVKVLNAGLDDPTVARRFRAEAVTVARLNHPGIATIYELVHHGDQWLMVMEFVRGETLEQVLVNENVLPVPRAADVAMQVLAALAHAHAMGVVHRDLKPANIMIAPGGGVKVMDFGIARVTGAEQLTSAGFMMGTPAYMAPEQVTGGAIDARTDLYAVGIVLFQMVTGHMPFAGATAVQLAQARINEPPASLAAVRPDLPAWLTQVVDIALARDPARRFQSAMHFRESIRRGLAGVPIDGEITPPASPTLGAPSAGALRVVKGASTAAASSPAAPHAITAPSPAGPRDVPAGEPLADRSSGGRRTPLVMAGLSAAVLFLLLAGWWTTRTVEEDEDQAPVPATAVDAGDAGTGATPETAVAPAPEPPASPVPASGGQPVPAPVVNPGAPSSPSSIAASAASAPGTAAPPPDTTTPASPIGAAPADAMFRGVRAFVVTGGKAEERPAVLAFADRVVTLFDDGGQVVLAAMPYGQITAAAYTRDRNPRWYPTLAGPPIDVDMPGGLFRGNRHWLALQSRDGWMIVRMNDGDWRQITGTVTAHLGLRVDQIRP